MFAEDIEILPRNIFSRLLEAAAKNPNDFIPMIKGLFASMRKGGYFGADHIEWFNGGLFDDDDALPLDHSALQLTLLAARLDWSDIEPSIFGTLFERGLDPNKRAQLGTHYTDSRSIMRLVTPAVIEPLSAEWEKTRRQIKALLAKSNGQKEKKAKNLFDSFMERLRGTRVLDPACGSGNFLYLTLCALKDLEHRIILEAEAFGFQRQFPQVGPQNVLGVEINEYAAELARVTVWIGQIQWMLRHGFGLNRNPVLENLEHIENRDALLGEDGREAIWPAADFIVGNPPFLGDKKMRSEMGDEYVDRLRGIYAGRVPGGADLVTYWFEKARQSIENGTTKAAGLVSTNSIRQKRNRPVLERILGTGRIFEAWPDEPWVNEGAAVRVSLVCFSSRQYGRPARLSEMHVETIRADLTGGTIGGPDITTAKSLSENVGRSFFGLCLAGKFSIPGEVARRWLKMPNPHGRPNSDVLRPLYNGADVLKGHKDRWVIDFGPKVEEAEAALYEAPFAYVLENVKPGRMNNREDIRVSKWWRLGRSRPELRKALLGLERYIATVETAKHRVFFWFPVSIAPEHKLIVITRDDDVTFGILSSRFHALWALAAGGRLGVGNDPVYNSTRCFETFPFPKGLSPNIPSIEFMKDPGAQRIAEASRRLVTLREAWLYPPEWVKRVPEVVPGYPDRLLPVDSAAEKELKKRTLTSLYNAMPPWLANVHRDLDNAVAAAYGWPPDLEDQEILERLLDLNKKDLLRPLLSQEKGIGPERNLRGRKKIFSYR